MVWLGLDLQFDWGLIGGELVKRSYIVVGMVALLLLLALGITSIPALLRRMGPGLAEAAQLDLRGGSAGAGTLLVVGQERVAGAPHLSGAGLRPAVATARAAAPLAQALKVAGRAAQQPSRP
jgi:sulfoxide reductase heme-binding subunit YedZ